MIHNENYSHHAINRNSKIGFMFRVSHRHHSRPHTTLANLVFALFLAGCSGNTNNKANVESSGYKETGMASCYASKFQNRKTASGEILNNNSMTAAHKTLPFGTEVIVKNLNNGKSVSVRINDRGPFIKGRIIDLTRTAFSQFANLGNGVAKVEIRIVK